MFKSLKGKLIVPVVGLLVITVAFIVVYVSVSVTDLAGYLTHERIIMASSIAEAQLGNLEDQTWMIAISVAANYTVVMNLTDWNTNQQARAYSRQAMVEYLQIIAVDMGVDSFVVRDAEGFIVLRLHDLEFYGDHDGSAAGAAALRGETTTSYSSTVTMPMGLNTTAPIWYGGEIIGTMTSLIFLHTEEFVDHFAWIFGAEVTIFGGAAGSTRLATTLLTAEGERAVGTEADASVIEEVLRQGRPLIEEVMLLGEPHHAYYMPLFNLAGNPVGMFFVGFSNARTIAATNAVQRNLLFIGVTSLLLVAAVMLLFIMRMVKPISLLTRTLDQSAKGDLTKRLPETGSDEIARASRSFNLTMEELRQMIIAIKKRSGDLADIGNELAVNMTETAAAMNQIAANIKSIKDRIMSQSASVTQTNSTMEQVIENINKLNDHVEHQSSNITQGSSAIEQMVANTLSVTETLIKNGKNVDALMTASDVGRGGLRGVAEDIQEISRESESLLEINSVMENIASQTNLLSMNAAIEAAHAGDAGKGFAVVADEIRKLAESSGEQSKIIGSVLKKMKGAIDKITSSTDNVLTGFASIDSSVKTVAEQESNIRHSMEEQGTGNRQILQAVSNVNEITRQVNLASHEMLGGAKEVIHESKNLEKVTQEITIGMNEMSAGAEQVNHAVNTVNDLTGRTRENIESLVQAVSRFKV
ncbi:MAG: methyl-accepting chemotaxis protein [Treponema sp.]|nr:methyl-accepting chemotaxis protein [Treponema sp.]